MLSSIKSPGFALGIWRTAKLAGRNQEILIGSRQGVKARMVLWSFKHPGCQWGAIENYETEAALCKWHCKKITLVEMWSENQIVDSGKRDTS